MHVCSFLFVSFFVFNNLSNHFLLLAGVADGNRGEIDAVVRGVKILTEYRRSAEKEGRRGASGAARVECRSGRRWGRSSPHNRAGVEGVQLNDSPISSRHKGGVVILAAVGGGRSR